MSEPRTYRALITFGGEDELITLTLDANSEIEGQARDDQQRADALLSAADTALLEACREALDRYIGTLCTRAHDAGDKECGAAQERTLLARLNERLEVK